MIEEVICKKQYIIFRQYLYMYGINSLLHELKLNEIKEDYETCKTIKDVIINHNRSVNDFLPTKL